MTASDSTLEIAVQVENASGSGPAVILCEHASNHIPARYDRLGLDDASARSHAAWDPGALLLARRLSVSLDSPLVAGGVSRLVYDCNRPPEAPSAMPARSELVDIPGNCAVTDDDRAERIESIYRPFCAATSQVIAERKQTTQPTALITVHSFTPVYFGTPREVEIGILHDTDTRMADLMLAQAPALPHRKVERNAPYGPEDGVAHSLKIHGQDNGLANVMIEVRNDLLETEAAVDMIASELLCLLRPALTHLYAEETPNA